MAVKEITNRIDSQEIEFDLITAKFKNNLPKFEKIGNVNVHRLGLGISSLDKLLLPFWGAVFALNLNRKKHYDFYWCIMATFASGAAYIANIMRFWEPVPVVLTLQEGDSEEHFKNRWFGLINLSWRLALKNTKILTVISSYLAERARKFGYRGGIKIIPNGVDIGRFNAALSQSEKMEIRKELNLETNDVLLITASRLTLKNGIADVIKALPKLPENVKFLILGEGELKEKLQKLAIDLNVSERVIFKGFISHERMPKYLKAADIFIRASLSEGMGNSFIEAMAAELPVIATPVGGIVDFLFDGKTGYFCQPENPQSVAESVKRAISDQNKTEIIKNAYNLAFKKYSWDVVVKDMREKVFLSSLE